MSMNMNPLEMMKIREHLNRFNADHPRMAPFLQAVSDTAMQEGTILELKAITPEGRELLTNIKLNAHDIETLQMLHQMRQ